MRPLVSIGIWTAGISLTIILYFAMLIITIISFPFDKKRKLAHAQCYWWASAIINLNPYWKLKIEGLENIDRHRAYVIVVNHQSLADIVVVYKTRMQFKWIAKEELFGLPFVGWSMSLAKHIKLSRGKYSSIKKVYKEAAQWLRNGMSVLFFPEGTRSETNDMKEFQNGAFKLAIKERKPVLPMAINGTGEAIPKRDWLFKTRVNGVLRVLPPIDTTLYKRDEFERLKEKVRLQLGDTLKK